MNSLTSHVFSDQENLKHGAQALAPPQGDGAL